MLRAVVGAHLVITQKDIDAGLRFEIEYWGGRRIVVQGAVTGQTYSFSGLSRTTLVDPRDAPAIVRNQMFRIKGAKRVEGEG